MNNDEVVACCFKCLYWLAKQETAHTKFRSLLELGKSLGCSFFNEREVGKNTSYRGGSRGGAQGAQAPP